MDQTTHPADDVDDARTQNDASRRIVAEIIATSDQARIIWGASAGISFVSFCLSSYADSPLMTGLSGTLAIFSAWNVAITAKASRRARGWLSELA